MNTLIRELEKRFELTPKGDGDSEQPNKRPQICPVDSLSSISPSCSTEYKEPLSQSNTHVQEPLKHSDVYVWTDPSSHTNLPLDHVINVLPNLVINAESQDIGCAFEVVSQVGGLATTTCIDTGSGINVISCQQLLCPGFEILSQQQADKLQVKVGNSTEVAINEEILTMVKIEKGFSQGLWFFIIDDLPVQTLIGFSAMKQCCLGLSDGHLTWKGWRCIQANLAQLNITLPQVTDPDFYINIERQDKTLVLLAETKAIPLRSSVFLPLMLSSCALSPEGFFFPSIGSESLLFLPGLVTIEQGKKHNTLNVLVMNHSETKVQVKKNLEVGMVYQLNDHDVKNTELLQLLKHSLIEPCLRKFVPKKQPLCTKSVNAKTGANYLCALTGPWLEKMIEDEDLFQKPKWKRQKLHDHQNGKSD